MSIKRTVSRVAAAGVLLVVPGVAWGGPSPAHGTVHHCDLATTGDPDAVARKPADPPVITGEDDFGTTSADAIVVSDPGPGDGGGPK